jgi:glycerol-3-phosphate dehydrogenase
MIIDENNVGIRIDKYLTDNTEYTRSKIQKMIDNGNILVNGKEVKSSYILKENDKIDKVDFVIHKDIVISTDMKVVVDSAELIIIAIPAKFLDSTSKELKKYYNNKQVICIASKGIEQNTCRFLYDVVRENINTNNIAIISGGTFAVDIVYKVPIGLTLATRSNIPIIRIATTIKKILLPSKILNAAPVLLVYII